MSNSQMVDVFRYKPVSNYYKNLNKRPICPICNHLHAAYWMQVLTYMATGHWVKNMKKIESYAMVLTVNRSLWNFGLPCSMIFIPQCWQQERKAALFCAVLLWMESKKNTELKDAENVSQSRPLATTCKTLVRLKQALCCIIYAQITVH